MDYLRRNGVLIDKSGDPKISKFKIPEVWIPLPDKSRDNILST